MDLSDLLFLLFRYAQINISTSSVAKFPLFWTASVKFDSFVGCFNGEVSLQFGYDLLSVFEH